MSNPINELAEQYPSVDVAYPLAIAAYDLAQKRLEAMESRLQTLIGFAATATLGIVTAASGKGHNFHSRWFVAAMAACAVGIAVATHARLYGELKVVNPQNLYNEWLSYSEWEFKKKFHLLVGRCVREEHRACKSKGPHGSV